MNSFAIASGMPAYIFYIYVGLEYYTVGSHASNSCLMFFSASISLEYSISCHLIPSFTFQWYPWDQLFKGYQNSGNNWTLHIFGEGCMLLCTVGLCSCILTFLFTSLIRGADLLWCIYSERSCCCWYCYRRGQYNIVENVWPWQKHLFDSVFWSLIKW